MPNKLFEIEYKTELSEGVNLVRATSIRAAIKKWATPYHEEDDIIGIKVLFHNVDDYRVVYWDWPPLGYEREILLRLWMWTVYLEVFSLPRRSRD